MLFVASLSSLLDSTKKAIHLIFGERLFFTWLTPKSGTDLVVFCNRKLCCFLHRIWYDFYDETSNDPNKTSDPPSGNDLSFPVRFDCALKRKFA